MLLDLQKHIVYGPVKSRRLGRSLGLNILPAGTKVCTFNCLYCQYGWTDPGALENRAGLQLPTRQQVAGALEAALERLTMPPEFITFSGNGEPTVHPEFPAIAQDVVGIRDKLAPGARTAILSNSTTAADPRIREALSRLDVRIMKLDVGTEERLRRYNQPVPGHRLESILAGLERLGGVTVQALFSGGPSGNSSEQDVAAWIEKVKALSPVAVQVYSLARGYPSREIRALTRSELQAIAAKLLEAGISSEVF